MVLVLLRDAAGQGYREDYPTRRAAQKRARAWVSRDGATAYKRQRKHTGTRYYHSYGEREAFVFLCDAGPMQDK